MRDVVQTVLGPVPIERLGRTLMHEHLQIAVPGWQFDWVEPPMRFSELVARCVDHVEALKDAGYASMVDPCPIDMGRDVELMREVASRTGFNIICATGFYHGEIGSSAHWKMRLWFDPDTRKRLTDLLVRELTEGIGETGIRPGVIKVATGRRVTFYEEAMLDVAAMASREAGVPITTHTEAIHGDVQLDRLCGPGGLAPRDIVVGHCCGSNDLEYLRGLIARGAYIGFDRFGMTDANSDVNRTASLAGLVGEGHGGNIVVSHDCVICFRGLENLRPMPEPGMLRFSNIIAPMLRAHGVTEEQIETLLQENPARFFSGSL